MNFENSSLYDKELEQRANFDVQDNDDDDDFEEKPVPLPLYFCTHKDDPKCNNKHPHPASPTHYNNVTSDTPCRYCGHRGTLYKVN